MAANPLIAKLAADTFNVQISWTLWALAAIVPGIVSIIVIPYLLYIIYPPEIKKYKEGKEIANLELAKMGRITYGEKVVVSVFIISLVLWATGSLTGINATTTAMIAVCALIAFNVITWDDVLSEKGGWDTLIWMGSLITFAGGLSKLGFVKWFATYAANSMSGISWVVAILILVLIYVYTHYFFASLTAHIAAMYATFGAVSIATGGGFAYACSSCICICFKFNDANHSLWRCTSSDYLWCWICYAK